MCSKISHPHILQLMAVVPQHDLNTLELVFEPIAHGSLYHYLHDEVCLFALHHCAFALHLNVFTSLFVTKLGWDEVERDYGRLWVGRAGVATIIHRL